MRIVIVDYGMGNIRSIESTLKYLGVTNIIISSESEDLANADKLILPGVGSFAKAMQEVQKLNLDQLLKKEVYENKKPILGICLGMQIMGKSSEEDGYNLGLGFVNANVTKFISNTLKVPHVGFNQVEINPNSKLFKNINTNCTDFYFTHSFKMDADKEVTNTYCNYEIQFVAAFEKENIAGVQFHPELSQSNGLLLLKNFINNF